MCSEDNLLMLSALQHILFCERQCALIHIEQLWQENVFTAQGKVMHERVDRSGGESRRNVRVEYGMPLRSLRLGLVGKADVVEFHQEEDDEKVRRPHPVEYKRGTKKKDNWDTVQLCAQALCLEEMLDVSVPQGALFYGRNRRRQVVVFEETLRSQTEEAAKRLHALISSGVTPKPVYTKKCTSCSFYSLCLPKTFAKTRKVERYLNQVLKEL